MTDLPSAQAPAAALALLCASCAAPALTAASVAGSGSSNRHGHVVHGKHHSDALGVDKDYVVYLPAGYDAAAATRWPTFYYLHGITSPETEWVELGKLDVAADDLGLRAIVVMPDGDDGFYADSAAPIDYEACMRDGDGLFDPSADHATTCVRNRAYETYIVRELVPHIDATFRTIATRDGRGIAGVSMGGFGAWSLALRHRDLFAAAASHSGLVALLFAGPHPYAAGKVELVAEPSRWETGKLGEWGRMIFGPNLANWRAYDPATLVQTLPPGGLALYLDCGTEDEHRFQDQAEYLDELLTERRIDHTFVLGPGHHNYDFWVARLPASLAFLRDHTAAAR